DDPFVDVQQRHVATGTTGEPIACDGGFVWHGQSFRYSGPARCTSDSGNNVCPIRSASFTNVCPYAGTDAGACSSGTTGNRRPSRLTTWPRCSAQVGEGNTTSA